ncbi:Reverse transcriptase domain and Integrase,catalytic core domain and Ribonuclease H-like domain-containing protein, partial [Strongyloides ratti]
FFKVDKLVIRTSILVLLEKEYPDYVYTEDQLETWIKDNLRLSGTTDKKRTVGLRQYLEEKLEESSSEESERGILARSTRWIGSVVNNLTQPRIELESTTESSFELSQDQILSVLEDMEGTRMQNYMWSQVQSFKSGNAKDIGPHIDQIERCFVFDKIDKDDLKIVALRLKVDNKINCYIDSLDNDIIKDYDKLTKDLRRKFSGTVGKWPALHKWRTFFLDTSSIEKLRSSFSEFENIMDSIDRKMMIEDRLIRLADKIREEYLFVHLRNNIESYNCMDDCRMDLEAVVLEHGTKTMRRNPNMNNRRIFQERKFEGNCNHCQIQGHKMVDCEIRKSGSPAGNYVKRDRFKGNSNHGGFKQNQTNSTDVLEGAGKLIVIYTEIKEFSILTLADAGSSTNIMRKSTLIKVGLEDQMKPCNTGLKGAFGKEVVAIGKVDVPFKLNGSNLRDEFLIIDDKDFGNPDVEILIGIDIWRRVGFSEIEKLDKQYRKLKIAGTPQTCNIQVVKTGLSNDQAYKRIKEICPEVIEIFSKDENDIGCYYKEIEPQTYLNEMAMPFKPYRYPQRMKDVAREMIDKLVEKKIIVRGYTEHLHNILIVKKPNSGFRAVTDLRSVNKNVVKTNYPAPNIEIALNSIAGADFYCTLDLPEAFHQFPLSVSDHGKFGIYFEGEVYYYVRMPMGFINAPMELQKEMNSITEECPNLKFFFDDGLITTKGSMETHMENIIRALNCLRQRGLKISLKKSVLVAEEVRYLGHLLSKNGIAINESSKESILKIAIPKNQEDIRKFLGSIGFFQRFIPDYSQTLCCITNLLGKNKVFNWGQECTDAFNKIKSDLIEHSQLAVEDLSKPLIIYSDASLIGYGGVICQKQDNGEIKPLTYYSRKRKMTKNKDSCYLEGMCILLMSRKYRHKLIGSRIFWYSDNLPLIYMFQRGTDHPKFASWCLELSCYDITFRHIEGKLNTFADFLSRYTELEMEKEEEEEASEPKCFVNNITTTYDIVKLQNEDEDIQKINDLEIMSGVKGRFEQVCGRIVFKPYIPDGEMREIIKRYHEYGHFNVKKLYHTIKLRYVNDNLQKLIKLVTDECVTCQTRNLHHNRIYIQKSLCVENPRDSYSLDICGPINLGSRWRYILLMVDVFSSYWIARPLIQTTSEEIREEMMVIFLNSGYPKQVRMDNASYLRSEKLSKALKELNIEVSFTTPYAHKGNTKVERGFHTLESMLSKCMKLDNNNKSWEEFLPVCTYYYNTAAMDDCGTTPYELFYGTSPNVPEESHLNASPGLVEKDIQLAEWKYKLAIVRNTAAALKLDRKLRKMNKVKNWIEFEIGQKIL